MRECIIEKNKAECNCTYEPCSKKGICCECMKYHWRMGELPACYFTKEQERTYNRSVQFYMSGR